MLLLLLQKEEVLMAHVISNRLRSELWWTLLTAVAVAREHSLQTGTLGEGINLLPERYFILPTTMQGNGCIRKYQCVLDH